MGNTKTKYDVCLVNLTGFEKKTFHAATRKRDIPHLVRELYGNNALPSGWKVRDAVFVLYHVNGTSGGWSLFGDDTIRGIEVQIQDDVVEFTGINVVQNSRYEQRDLTKFIQRA